MNLLWFFWLLRSCLAAGIFDDVPDYQELTLDYVINSYEIPANIDQLLVYSRRRKVPVPVIEYVLDHWPVDVNLRYHNRVTALANAIGKDDVPAMLALLRKGAEATLIHFDWAIMESDSDLAKAFIEEAGDRFTNQEYTEIFAEALTDGPIENAKLMLQMHPEKINCQFSNEYHECVLISAVKEPGSNVPILQMLSRRGQGIDLNVKSKRGRDCFYYASSYNLFDNLIFLLDVAVQQGYQVNFKLLRRRVRRLENHERALEAIDIAEEEMMLKKQGQN